MNDIGSVLDLLRQQANRDGLASASAAELEKYATALCFSQAFSHFGSHEYPQLCETVRIHLLRAHIGNLQSHVVRLHDHITKLNESNTKLQKLVVVLTVASLLGTAAQIWFAYKADKRQDTVEAASLQADKARQLQLSAPTPATPPTTHPAASKVTGSKTTKAKTGS